MTTLENICLRKSLRMTIKLCLFAASAATALLGQNAPDLNVRQLTVGQSIERELKGDEYHSYSLALTAGQFLDLVVEQKGIDVVVTLIDANNKKLAEVDSPNGAQGPERLSTIIDTTATFRLEVRSLEKTAAAGLYEVKFIELRAATEKDKNLIAAQRAFNEGVALQTQGTAESQRGAIKKYEEAIRFYRASEDRSGEAITLTNIAVVSMNLGDPQKALEYFLQALPLWKAVGDKALEAVTQNNVAFLYQRQGDSKRALENFAQAAALYRAVGDKAGEGTALSNIGAAYDALGDSQKALENYTQGLALQRAMGDKSGEAMTLDGIGGLYDKLGEPQKAIEYLTQALSLERAIGAKANEAITLNNLGLVYDRLGDRQKALNYYAQALPLEREVGDKNTEAATLSNIGMVYGSLGELQKALEYHTQALPLRREVGDKAGEAIALSNIGSVYNGLHDLKKALDYYGQALALERVVGDIAGEATTLNNIGAAYGTLGDTQKALEYHMQALPLRRAVGNQAGEAMTLNNIGLTYQKSGEQRKALEYYAQALPLWRVVGEKEGEAGLLDDVSNLMNRFGNRRFAVVLGKSSINYYQELRSNIAKLDKAVQQTYLKSIEKPYRRVADILVTDKRFAEAQQVLNLFKDQQFFDFDGRGKPLAPLALTLRETDFVARYNSLVDKVGEANNQLVAQRRSTGDRKPTTDEESKIKGLENRLAVANGDYLAFLETAEKEFAAPPDDNDNVPTIADLQIMQTMLRETSDPAKKSVVAVYTLVGEEKFHALIITSDSIQGVSTPIKGADLNEKAKQYWALLQSPTYDPTTLGLELYNTVFKPIEKDLPKETKTILWSLDGNLRYVPMAALFDGNQYLVERYDHVNFTRADKERMTRDLVPNWTATAFGSSKEQTIELLGNKMHFRPLPGVGKELGMLFKQKDKTGGIFVGETFQDAKFSQKTMLAALTAKRPVVHVASHFAFQPGNEERSFLVMGDGTAFTLANMKKNTNMFAGVDLLTLSACNTAAQQADARGREVDAFFELAQRLGANSVMASLWSVADKSTPWLMREFYRMKIDHKLSKAEALRRAQITLLSGSAKIGGPTTRSDSSKVKIELTDSVNRSKMSDDSSRSEIIHILKQDAPLFDKSRHPSFAHPFYWAEFVLFGNWK